MRNAPKLSNFLPGYLEVMELVAEKGFHHIEYHDVRNCAADRMRFYRLRNALINDPEAPQKLKEFAPFMQINWQKGGKILELFDARTKKSYADVLLGSIKDAKEGIVHDTFGGVLDEDILNYPLNPEDDGKGFLE